MSLLERLAADERPIFQAVLPELPGFDGRPLPGGQPRWEPFLEVLQAAVAEQPGGD